MGRQVNTLSVVDAVEQVVTVEAVALLSDCISVSRAAVPDDLSSVALSSTVLCLSAGLSLVKQIHYVR